MPPPEPAIVGVGRSERGWPAETWVRWIGAVSALTSLAALVGQLFGLLPLVYGVTFAGVPSVVLMFALAVLARQVRATVFLACLRGGLLGGLAATLGYDVFRWLVRVLGLLDYNGFVSIYIFGSWISGQPRTSAAAAAAGWIYHFWNGLAFGVFYALAFGRRRWWLGVAYGVVMELFMLGLFPLMPLVTTRRDFIVGSLAGHVVYGAVLGAMCQRWALNWQDVPIGERRAVDA